MLAAKIFKSGRSQAVRPPKEYYFDQDEVMVNRIGEIVILMPKTNKWNSFIQALKMFSDDFMKDSGVDNLKQVRGKL